MSTSTDIGNKKKRYSWWRSYKSIRTYTECIKMYAISFTESNKKISLSLHYNGAKSCFLVNGT